MFMNTQLLSETKSSLKARLSPDLEDARYGAFTQGKNTYTYAYKKLGVKEEVCKGTDFREFMVCTYTVQHLPVHVISHPQK